MATMSVDCWLSVLDQIPANERSKYRMVCRQWRDMIDYLTYNQKCLELYSSKCDTNMQMTSNNSNRFCWSQEHILYNEFCQVFQKYPNLREVVFNSFSQWNDHHLIRLTEMCPNLLKLAFYSCPNLGDNFHNDFGFQSVTQIGWHRLAFSYGKQLTTLILEDCDLENQHLALVVKSFRNLRHLNIANNSKINNFRSLYDLPSTIEVLKLGPKINEFASNNRYLYNCEMPIEEIIGSRARDLRVLQLQGFLTSKLVLLNRLPMLEHLIIKYFSASLYEEVFNKEIDIFISLLSHLKNLYELNLYQVNQSNHNDFQWLRHRFANINVPHMSRLYPSSLRKFSLHSTQPLVVVDQFRLINFVLSSSPKLFSFSLSCSSFDPTLHYNLNQTILILLQKYGSKLKEIKLENLFSSDSYLYLAYVILTCSNLEKFAIEESEIEVFLDSIEMQIDQLDSNEKTLHREKPLEVTFLASDQSQIEFWHSQNILTQYDHLNELVHINFGLKQNHQYLHDVGLCEKECSELIPTNEDLSDLCVLIDSSFDLITHLVDVVGLFTSYFGLFVQYFMFCRPTKILNYSIGLFKIR